MSNDEELYIDLYCGFGGWETGLSLVSKRRPVRPYRRIAINHNPVAIRTHSQNHPDTLHLTEDINLVAPRRVTGGKRPDILTASPSCVHFSRARAGRPKEEQERAGPWRVVDWMAETRPRAVAVENVVELLDWGALDDEGNPIPALKGKIFKAWINAMQSLGYHVDYRVLCSADYGDATTRERLYIIARRDRPCFWPEPTHAKDGAGGLLPWRPAWEIVDLSNLGRSIYGRKEPLVESTLARIRTGLFRFAGMLPRERMEDYLGQAILEAATKGPVQTYFLTKYYRTGTAVSLNDPLDTVTTKDRFGLVSLVLEEAQIIRDIRYRVLTAGELALAMSFEEYRLTGVHSEDVKMIGNAVAARTAGAVIETLLN